MPNFKLTELPQISAVDFDSNDLFYVVDSQSDESKSIRYSSLAGNNINTLSSYTIQNTSNVVFLSSIIDNNATNIATNTAGEAALGVRIEGLSGSIDENTTDILNISTIAVNNTVGELATDILVVSGGLNALSAQVQEQEDNDDVQAVVQSLTARVAQYLPLSGGNILGTVFLSGGNTFGSPNISNTNFTLEVSGGIGTDVVYGREEFDALFLYSDPDTAPNNFTTGGSRITLHANDAVGPDGSPVPNQAYYDATFHNFRSLTGGNIFSVHSSESAVNVTNQLYVNGNANVSSLFSANSAIFSDGSDNGAVTTDKLFADKANITTSLTKPGGSFKIDHPIPEKKDTHNLIHSFVEAPKADNLYRGKVNLVNGSATVNLDTASGMTEGTFVLLNTEIQCFPVNESGFTPVKSSISGNILTITAQDSSSNDTISWLVIGERHDEYMMNADWTDENGKVIIEPLKGD